MAIGKMGLSLFWSLGQTGLRTIGTKWPFEALGHMAYMGFSTFGVLVQIGSGGKFFFILFHTMPHYFILCHTIPYYAILINNRDTHILYCIYIL